MSVKLQTIKMSRHLNFLRFSLLNLNKRMAHTDFNMPNWDKYKRNPKQKMEGRKNCVYLTSAIGTIISLYGAKCIGMHYVLSMAASADVLALAKIEINLDEIPEGRHATFKWRGKPLFIKHRTPTEIETERSTPLEILRDPESDEDRAKRPEWLVTIGVCTHLGCVPIANSGDYPGGYYCPCHGSHYDAAGRIRKGPAPTNLEIPIHDFPNENTLIVG